MQGNAPTVKATKEAKTTQEQLTMGFAGAIKRSLGQASDEQDMPLDLN